MGGGFILITLLALGLGALYLMPRARRGPAPALVRTATLGFLVAMGVLLAVRGELLVGLGLIGIAALAAVGRLPRLRLRGSDPVASGSGPMTLAEAYQVLGLTTGVDEAAIRDAHRALMQKLHPDRGGTTYLAVKLNQARDLLLEHIERKP